jgi:hypothetical protein
LASQNNADNKNWTSLVELVDTANWIAAKEHMGSATCTTLRLLTTQDANEYKIQTLNIGDSGYSIHRRTNNNSDGKKELKMIYSSIPGQKRFNFPHQLGGEYGDVVAKVGVEKEHVLEADDIIVVYSDGVSDNLFPHQFHACIDGGMDKDMEDNNSMMILSYSWIADCIARSAYELGKDKSFDSPFAQGAREAGWGMNFNGGKHDDITVVVAQIRAQPEHIEVLENDPHFEESIYVYTGPVPPKDQLQKLSQLDLKKQKVMVNEEL